jgi:hypothetical protein
VREVAAAAASCFLDEKREKKGAKNYESIFLFLGGLDRAARSDERGARESRTSQTGMPPEKSGERMPRWLAEGAPPHGYVGEGRKGKRGGGADVEDDRHCSTDPPHSQQTGVQSLFLRGGGEKGGSVAGSGRG